MTEETKTVEPPREPVAAELEGFKMRQLGGGCMSGNYPDDVTQRHIDEAAGGYDEWQRCTVCGQMRNSPCREGDCGNEPESEDQAP